jgi:tetratricopeptide (TPR) repeat protein
MRVLFFILVLAFSAFAQTPFVSQTFESAGSAAREKRYEQAIEKYRATILHAETEHLDEMFRAKIHFNIGVCFYHLKRTSEAVEEFTEAIKLSKREHQRAFYALGMAQKDLKNWRKAKNAFRDSLRIKKDDGEAWFDLGLVYLEEKDYSSSAKAFESSIKYKSVNSADAHNNLGVIAALGNDWNFAEKEFKKALINKSVEAFGNLQFCKYYKRNLSVKDLLAKLEFSRTTKRGE